MGQALRPKDPEVIEAKLILLIDQLKEAKDPIAMVDANWGELRKKIHEMLRELGIIRRLDT